MIRIDNLTPGCAAKFITTSILKLAKNFSSFLSVNLFYEFKFLLTLIF